MATGTQPTASTAPRFDFYRLDLEQVEKMARAGVFRDDDRVELLGGLLVQRMTKQPPHSFAAGELFDCLNSMLPRPWFVRKEEPIGLGPYWRPEPDLMILLGPRRRFGDRIPTIADVAFLVEVADSSYRIDRWAKWRGYASTGVPTYWIVNLNARQIEVYRDPTGKGSSAIYRTIETFGEGASVPVIIDGVEVGQVVVNEMLP